jgi:probable rRNA maturation factor
VRVTASARCPLRPAGVARLARAVLGAERSGGTLAALSVAFVGPDRIRQLNRRHLGQQAATDVIAFTLGATAGDVYVCVRVAAAQARRHGVTLREELRRLVIHGVLHVLGHEHPAGEERTASPMWRLQERYLTRFGALAP